jgi:branched-chain amino acid aminotransferase
VARRDGGSLRPAADRAGGRRLQYGASIFEGLKVYRRHDGSLAAFRPDANARRFRASSVRMGMPELPDDIFRTAIRELLAVDHAWVPAAGTEASLYLRPFLLSTSPGLRPGVGGDHLFVLIGGPAGSYFPGGLAPVRAWMGSSQVRAWPGGTGAAKAGANYAASLAAQTEAQAHGCDQVVWLDAQEHRYVEEMGVMNLFFVIGDRDRTEVVTPALNGSFLAGVTRDSLLTLAADLGADVAERPVPAREWLDRARDGSLREVFASGTAAVVLPVGAVVDHDGETRIADGDPGPVTVALREALTGIQQGRRTDPHGWAQPV